MKGVTKRQREILNYIETFIQVNHYSPSYREIMQHFGFASLGSVYKHLIALKRKDLIHNEPSCSRSLALAEGCNRLSVELELPFIGYVRAGYPIEMLPQVQTLAVPQSLIHNP